MDVPNHTQIPNSIIDEHMKSLSPAQFKVLIAICRKTIGWHKQSDYISISQIVELAGVSNKTVIAAVRDLEQFGFIVTQKSNRTTTHITLNYNVTSVLSTPPSGATTQDASGITTHTKETLKETIYKERMIPTLDEVVSYFTSNGYTVEAANKMYDFYQASISSNRQKYWKDSRGNAVKSWKQKAQSVWFKPEHKDQGADSWSTQGFKSVDVL
jgi:phage replication O-like protein O